MARKPTQTAKETEKKKPLDMPESPPTSEAVEPLNYGAEYRSRCGGALRAAREKLGLSTQEIANRLRLSSKQIEALEADNFDVLPEATIVKGFIRNYAKQLKIDAEPLLDAYIVIVPSKQPQSFTLHPSVDVKVTEYQKPNTMRFALFGLAAALGFGTWLFYQTYVQKPNPVNPAAELTQPSVAEALPEAALPAAERRTDEATTQLALPSVGATSATEVAGGTSNTSVPAAPETTPSATVAAPASPLVPQPPVLQEAGLPQLEAGMSRLELNANQETWISVTDASGKEVYSKTLYEGNRETLQIKTPVNITVGNSLGTALSVNGKPIDLAPHTRTNVAHVKVD